MRFGIYPINLLIVNEASSDCGHTRCACKIWRLRDIGGEHYRGELLAGGGVHCVLQPEGLFGLSSRLWMSVESWAEALLKKTMRITTR